MRRGEGRGEGRRGEDGRFTLCLRAGLATVRIWFPLLRWLRLCLRLRLHWRLRLLRVLH